MQTGEPAGLGSRDGRVGAEAYVRRTLWQLLGGIGVLFVGMAAATLFFEPELVALTTTISNVIGVPGMAITILLIDTLTVPVPPDAVLVVIAHGPLHDVWLPLVVGLGLVSAVGGNLGYLASGALGQTPFVQRVIGPHRSRMEGLFERYGALAVALGALTPIPFSITCWAAGVLRMRWPTLALVSLLRVPRFLVYYWVIAASAAAVG
jgi:membrane protein YqaA with SNARE-associated domain